MDEKEQQFQHFIKTGRYLYKGVEYTDPPHQLEIDTGRGVMYLHNVIMATTILRVCRLNDTARNAPSDLICLVIDLVNSPYSNKRTSGRTVKKFPVFLKISGVESIMDMKVPPNGDFQIVDKTGGECYDFKNVPGQLLYDLWVGKFVDIIMGYTGVVKS
jgi:hypothetical protein